MRRTKLNRVIAVCISLMIALQCIMPSVAFAMQREVAVDNRTSITDQAKVVTGISIDGVEKPVTGAKFDDAATVTTAEGISWEIPVLWVRDDLQIDTDTVDEGHSYLPVLAFFVPKDYALIEDVFIVTLSDSLAGLFGTQETISVFDASVGITYIVPASFRGLFAREEHAGAPDTSTKEQSRTQQAEAQQTEEQQTKAPQVKELEERQEEQPEASFDGYGTIVDIYCAQTARNVLSDDDLQWLIELIMDYLEPQAVELLLNKFPAFREGAQNGEIGKEISLYIYYNKGDKDGRPEHEAAVSALAYVAADVRIIDGVLKYCYMLAVDVSDLIKMDANKRPVRDEEGYYKLLREGTAITTLENTIVHELFHALMHDYNRTGMAGATNLQDRVTYNGRLPTQELFNRYQVLHYPPWFIEGTASAVENVYSFRYAYFQIFRGLQDENGRFGAGRLNSEYTPLLILNNYLDARYKDGSYVYFELEWSRGGTQNNGRPIDTAPSRYVTGYLATLYLSELAARYRGNYAPTASSVQTVNGVTAVDSGKLRDGLDSILKWMHEGATLDQVISMISPQDENGQPIFMDTKSFEERFIRGVKQADGKYWATEDNDSLMFVYQFLNYMLRLDAQLPNNEVPNGSVLFDFDQRFDSPLDSSKKSSSEYLEIVDSNSMVPSTVMNDTPNIGGGKSNPDQVVIDVQVQPMSQAAKDDALPMAAKSISTNELAGVDENNAEDASKANAAIEGPVGTDNVAKADTATDEANVTGAIGSESAHVTDESSAGTDAAAVLTTGVAEDTGTTVVPELGVLEPAG